MAQPQLIGRAIFAIVSDERVRKSMAWTIGLGLSPIILIIILICGMLSGTTEHNNRAINLCFNGGVIADNIPQEYRGYIEDMRNSFNLLDGTIEKVNKEMENDNSLDSTRVKAIFYALFFGAESPSRVEYNKFIECFFVYEQRTRTITTIDNDGNEISEEEIYTVAVPIKEMPLIYANILQTMDITVTAENQTNATEIYYRVLYGNSGGIEGIPLPTTPFIGADGFCSPLGENWRAMVTSEFGYRKDPFTGETAGHSGMDLGAPKGTQIHSALDGTVTLVRYLNTGYGYHLMVDHGGGFVTMYAHCSKILVSEGQAVKAGEVIAEVGTTGRSTGNHLHFEIRINGEKQNPRSYLP
ncbi:MAG: M23 family metallopeptidase [Anaerotignaceae bacterium]